MLEVCVVGGRAVSVVVALVVFVVDAVLDVAVAIIAVRPSLPSSFMPSRCRRRHYCHRVAVVVVLSSAASSNVCRPQPIFVRVMSGWRYCPCRRCLVTRSDVDVRRRG